MNRKRIVLVLIGTMFLGGLLYLGRPFPEPDAPTSNVAPAAVVTKTSESPTTTEPAVRSTDEKLPSFTKQSLARYDGSDVSLPIYIALEGKVYDVSAGKSYYEPGGAYHFLAGTDGTEVLRMMGGDVIKRKYPVIGVYGELP